FGSVAPPKTLVLNEFMFDVAADNAGTPELEGDANGDGVRSPRGDEFIEIVNTGAVSASLGGYQILERGLLPVFTFPDTAVLHPGQYAVVFGGVGPAGFGTQLPAAAQYYAAKPGQADSGFSSSASRTNYIGSGDNIIFFDPRSNVVFGEVFWGSGVQETLEGQKLLAPYTFLGDSIAGAIGQSVTRNPDVTGKWTRSMSYVTAPYTPGAPSVVTGVGEDVAALPEAFELEQNYPNPFNPTTNFGFRIADFGFVRVSVFDLLGREVAVLVDGELMPGRHVVRWDASEMPSGVYVYTMTVGTERHIRRMLLLK
ncbi:MAG: lamin tail domain-containing protein, partial [Bacteroidetes bacterium]|nr:lamin tail domain-containing protein [Bacteroidota bacterium]